MPAARRADDEVTIGELGRRIDDFRASTERAFTDIRTELGAFESRFVSRELYDAELQGIKDRLSHSENSQTWQARALAGFILTTIAGVIGALVTVVH